MNGRIGLLAAVLAAQLLLLVLIWTTSRADAPTAAALLTFEPDQVQRIEISAGSGADAASATLLRSSDGWRMNDLPVDGSRVGEMLDKLAGLRSPWPVATTAVARERFEVTTDTYQKRVRLFDTEAGEDAVAELYLGTSPGFKRIHARRADGDAVYSIALSSLDLPVAPDDWLDKALLATDAEITGLTRQGHWSLTLASSPEPGTAPPRRWKLQAGPTGPAAAASVEADDEAVAGLITRFKSLRVIGVADAETGLPAPEPSDRFLLQTSAGETLNYSVYVDSEQDRYSMEREDAPGRFEVAGYIVEQLTIPADGLEAKPEPPADEEPEGAAGEEEPTPGEAELPAAADAATESE